MDNSYFKYVPRTSAFLRICCVYMKYGSSHNDNYVLKGTVYLQSILFSLKYTLSPAVSIYGDIYGF
jgi:hypothetical protein